jgi:hypothetical protein
MKTTILALCLLIAAAGFAQKTPVVKPRAKAQDYAAVKDQPNFTIGAAQLSQKQVRKTFVSNVRKDYVVVEVGFYPKTDSKISPQAFVLREQNAKQAITPADPQLLAARINDKNQKGQDVSIHPVVGVEYSTGPSPYDSYDRGGWHTEKGVMVGVNGKKKDPKTSAGDRKAMTAELSEKGLPEITTAAPVAGYLYFPATANRNAHYQLEYQTPNGPVVIPLPTPAD